MELHAQLACAMPRDPRMVAAGPMARLVYVEAVLYCRENLTDGVIDRLTLPFWCSDVPAKTRTKHLDRLVEVGALERHDAGWQFPNKVWAKWNPSRAQVDEKRAAEAERVREYRERKKAERQPSEDRTRVQNRTDTRAYEQPEPEPEPEPEPVTGTSQSVTHAESTNGNGRTDGPIGDVIQLLSARLASEHPSRIPGAEANHRAVIANDVATKHGALIAARIAQLPNSTPAVIAESLRREIQ